jgi:hypothetical protein
MTKRCCRINDFPIIDATAPLIVKHSRKGPVELSLGMKFEV